MNPNADYLGIVTMLRSLREPGLVSGSEAKKIAARLRVQLGDMYPIFWTLAQK